jgi:gelsolin
MKVYLVDQGNLKEISKPVFSMGDVYVVDDDKTIYIWIGSKASVDEKTAGAAQARTLDQRRGGAAKIITVDENQEPNTFLKLINPMGAMKVVEKNIAKTLLKDVSTGDWAGFEEWKNILYRVSAEEFEGINTMKMNQVPFTKDSLDSEDCFVADLGNKVYIWQGRTCNVKEKVKAGQWARNIDFERAGSQNEKIFEEGDDSEFLAALERGVDYKESDAVQLRAESVLEPETEADKAEAEIQPELKSEVKEVSPAEIKADIAKIKASSASSAGPGIPGSRDDSILTVEKPEGRRRCPKCGIEDKYMIHETVDKSNIILDYPRVYGHKYKCGSCGIEWREK